MQKELSIRDHDHGVDSKADDFINRFKHELKLQRLESLLRNRELPGDWLCSTDRAFDAPPLRIKTPFIGVTMGRHKTFTNLKEVFPSDEKHGRFGEMMVGMLPEDLPFTVFMPSARAFERDIGLQAADGDTNSTRNDSYAVVCRILGVLGSTSSSTFDNTCSWRGGLSMIHCPD
ncbi:unnamed protein product [Linum tenue]|uniref:Uncharacterized protein n=1 Tax=Linum tenue TaxID=586396 RepID=A0AAV0M9Z3_9ROSI|nr:unnamed protein product [Linum tenue]